MKNLEEITAILAEVDDNTFDKIDDAYYDMILKSGNERRNARKRFLYNIKKIGITEEEYTEWSNW